MDDFEIFLMTHRFCGAESGPISWMMALHLGQVGLGAGGLGVGGHVLRHGAPPPLQRPRVVGGVAADPGELKHSNVGRGYYKRQTSKNDKGKNGGWFPTIFGAYNSK